MLRRRQKVTFVCSFNRLSALCIGDVLVLVIRDMGAIFAPVMDVRWARGMARETIPS